MTLIHKYKLYNIDKELNVKTSQFTFVIIIIIIIIIIITFKRYHCIELVYLWIFMEFCYLKSARII